MTTLDPDQISRDYLAGATPSELARRYGCPLADIEAVLTATATPRRKRGGNRLGAYQSRAEAQEAIAARNARILELHATGKAVTEIMAAVGLQRAAVCKILRQANGKRPVATDAEIVALRRAGAAIGAIVRAAHVSHRRAIRALAAADLLDTAPPDLAARTAEILRRRRTGEHPKAIAAALGIGETTVYRALLGAEDLPPLRQPKPRPVKKPKQAKPPKVTPPPADHPRPVLLDRPFVPAPTPTTAPTQITHRTCPHCKVGIRLTNWIDHQEHVHGRVNERRTHDDAPVALLPPRPEPQRTPEPPCDICGAARCPTPLICGRHRRARTQHHYQPRR